DQRDRFRVEEEVGDETSPVFPENAANFVKIISHGLGKEVSKDGRKEYEIERIVFVRKTKILGIVLAERVEKLVMQVGNFKVKIRELRRDVVDAPIHALGAGIEPVVFTPSRQIAGKRQRHSSDTTPNVEHLVVWTKLPMLDEVVKVL